jgi:hypothetical protein
MYAYWLVFIIPPLPSEEEMSGFTPSPFFPRIPIGHCHVWRSQAALTLQSLHRSYLLHPLHWLRLRYVHALFLSLCHASPVNLRTQEYSRRVLQLN